MILRLLALGLLCFLARAVSDTGPKDFRQKWSLSRQDIVVAMPVDKNHLTLAKGSRVWRRVSLAQPGSLATLKLN